MMRRCHSLLSAGLVGNGVIAVRREDKNVWERRTPLTPKQVADLLERGEVKKVIVQPSTIRCYRDEEYKDVGAVISEDISAASTICAVKEVPPQLLIPERTYLFFSHTIKAQPYNMGLLDTILDRRIRLIDYERIVGPDGRLVKFGPYAGFAGMIDTLHALGTALLMKGFATPFLSASLSKEYRSLESAREDLLVLGNAIRKFGLPKEIGPLTIAVTGSGSVSLAAQEVLHHLPCKYVNAEDLPRLWKSRSFDNKHIYVVVVTAKDMVAPKDESKAFNKQHYYRHPEEYKAVYHKNIAPYVHVLMNGIYWEEKYPRLLTIAQARLLQKEGRFPLLCLGDITCDVGGSVEFFVKATTIQNPFYVYRLEQNDTQNVHDYNGDGVLILGVDHLPAEFPREASTDFGEGLVPLIERIALSDGTASLNQQKKQLGPEIFNAVVTNQGKLTPHYEYIAELRRQNELKAGSKPTSKDQKKILIVGSGMTAGPCVERLLQNPNNTITIADASADSLATLMKNFGSERVTALTTNAALVDIELQKAIKASDVVVSLLPATMHPTIAKHTIASKVPLVTASYTSPGMKSLRQEAEQNGTFVINELGLDPGIDIMTSAKLLRSIRSEGGVIQSYVSLCGALPAPENSDCPLGYKFSWSPRGVLTAASRPTKFRAGGKWFDVPGKYLYYLIQPLTAFSGIDLHWIPNGDATPYSSLYQLPDDEVKHIVRGTLRYRTYAPAVCAFAAIGLIDDSVVFEELKNSEKEKTSWAKIITQLLDRQDAPQAATLQERLKAHITEKVGATYEACCKLEAFQALQKECLMGEQPMSRMKRHIAEEAASVVDEMDTLGLLGYDHAPKTDGGAVIDSLCVTMQRGPMAYASHERDMVLMIHRITANFPNSGKTKTYTATLTQRGETTARSATAKTVGAPVGITAQMVLDGAFKGHSGLLLPTLPELYEPCLDALEDMGIIMHETVSDE